MSRGARTRVAAPHVVSGTPGTKEAARSPFAPRVRVPAPKLIAATVGGKFSTLPPPPALVVRQKAVPLVAVATDAVAAARAAATRLDPVALALEEARAPAAPVVAVEPAPAPLYPDPLRPALPWDPEADDTLVVLAVRQETHDVKTFVLAPPTPTRFAYQPGQFITLDLEIGGERINRCYTISSSPSRPDTISITVKRVPGGPVSNFLHDTLEPGSVIRAVGPIGEFTSARHPARKYLFLSGGSGVTPLMSMARWHHDLCTGADIAFVHAARTPADIVFRAELELIARRESAFAFVPVCERDTPAERWGGFRGRISRALLEVAVPDFTDRETFVCGPAPFMNAVKNLLREAGYDMARHHEESFDFGTLAAQDPAFAAEVLAAEAAAPDVPVHKVTFAKSGRTVDVRADTFVLEAARRAGMRLPSSCTKGMCGTCKSRLTSGTVAMTHGGGIRQKEIDAGMVLICCAKPTSDLVIER